MGIELQTPRHDYPTLIAHAFAALPLDQQTPDGFVRHRAAMRRTFLGMFREQGLTPEDLGRELGDFAFAADNFEREQFGRVVTPPTEDSQYDYPDLIETWFDSLPADRQSAEAITDHRNVLRASISEAMAKAGLDRAALNRELALFDAEAEAHLAARFGTLAAKEPTPARVASPVRDTDLPALDAPLGAWRWIGVIWMACGWAAAAAGALMALIAPLVDVGRVSMPNLAAAALVLSGIVLVAAIPLLANTVRRYRGLGFVLFSLPMILFSMGLAAIPPQLIMLAANSMGADFLPLALPLGAGFFAVVAMGALWLIARRFFGARKPLSEPGEDGRTHPVMAILLTGFSVLFFTIGAREMLGWGPGPALVAGLFVTGLILRIFRDREIGFGYVIILSLPLALLATEMPPSNLSALTILVLALIASALIALVTTLRGQRRSSFFSALTAASLALLLVIAPTSPTPAAWAADWTGHALRPLADRLMTGYGALYQTEYGRPILAMVTGSRRGAAEVQITDLGEVGGGLAISVTIRNIGERGISALRIYLAGDAGRAALANECDRAVADLALRTPIWPDEQHQLTVRWAQPDGCQPGPLADLAGQIRSDMKDHGGRMFVSSLVTTTEKFDPAEMFRKEARAWLEF